MATPSKFEPDVQDCRQSLQVKQDSCSDLILKRRSIKGRITKFNNYLNSLPTDKPLSSKDYNKLSIQFEAFTKMYDDFGNLQTRLEILNEASLDDELDERSKIENDFFDNMYSAKLILGLISDPKSSAIDDGELVSANDCSHCSHNYGGDDMGFRLPMIQIPSFDGNYFKWLSFHDTFESLIHNNKKIRPVHKFHYLVSYLEGEAARVISNLEISDKNYSEAWTLLCERYNNKRQLINNHLNSLFKLDTISRESDRSLRFLVDHVSKNLRALQNLGQPTDKWDTLIIYLMASKLDNNTNVKWEEHRNTLASSEIPSLNDFYKFLKDRADVLESVNRSKQDKATMLPVPSNNNSSNKSQRFNKVFNAVSVSADQVMQRCFFCKGQHKIYDCLSFKSLAIDDRIKRAAALKLCLNCLRDGHPTSACKLSNCRICKKRHNTLLHKQDSITHSSTRNPCLSDNTNTNDSSKITNSSTTSLSACSDNTVLLSTALVNVINPVTKQMEMARALLDCGSTASFITTSLKNKLLLNTRLLADSTIVGIGNSLLNNQSEVCTISLASRCNSFNVTLSCLVLPEITDTIPKNYLDIQKFNIPKDMLLADPNFYSPGEIEMLIGADLFWDLLDPQQYSLGVNMPTLRNSKLGWFLTGSFHHDSVNTGAKRINCNFSVTEQLNDQLKKFWELEEVPEVRERLDPYNPCEKHYITNTVRLADGRFSVRLPLVDTPDCLGSSYNIAEKRFFNLERRFDRHKLLKEMYSSFMKEYEELGHMSESSMLKSGLVYFIPHHAVLRESSESTKLRVVYDASCRTNSGYSVNDLLMIGPNIQDSLFNILVRFRQHKYVITGDIEKMYRQIQVNELDRNLQLILWRSDSSMPLKAYRLNTLTYGFACASYISTRCLYQLGEECQSDRIKSVLQNDFYVDDMITGAETEADLISIQREVSQVLASGCFILRKFRSNCKNAIEAIEGSCPDNLVISQSCNTLGLNWNPTTDTLQCPITIFDAKSTNITKRSILSHTFQIFDPLGLLSACTIVPKLLMKRLWALKIDWDDTNLPVDVRRSWIQFVRELDHISKISIPRNVIGYLHVSVEIHAFSDASKMAYAACLYMKSIDRAGNVNVQLYCAKSRVAPSKPELTIPRLELSGAVLAARLVAAVSSAITKEISRSYIWTDSSIVLGWLTIEPSRLKSWVCNRVVQIRELVSDVSWQHVPTDQNPADLASRGMNPREISDCALWWNGPMFLRGSETLWPKLDSSDQVQVPELKVHTTITFQIITPCVDINKYSSLPFAQRVVAYVIRFIHNCNNSKQKITGQLSVNELNTAFAHLAKFSQVDSFPNELQSLHKQVQLKPKSHIVSLNPFLDSQGLIRVGGRIGQSSYDFDKKHPILLHKAHHFTKILFSHEHIRLLHAGPQLLLASLRERVWTIGGRDLARRTVRSCIICRRMAARPMQTLMGNLPIERLTPDFPFSTVAVDFAGPFMITDRKGRGCKISKAYLCIFICFRTKCVHMEAVSDLSKDAFVMTLRRFIARRGRPRQIFCDNGKNFVAAEKEISLFLKNNCNYIVDSMNTYNIEFKFSPAYAPNFNGLVESSVKLAKHHIQRIFNNRHFTFEELSTLFAQVEAVLNSRPLCPLSSSPSDYTALTPGHFLLGRPLAALPAPDLTDDNRTRLNRYEQIEQARQHFWRRWQSEYISELQQRIKWRVRCRDIQPGDMVLLKEEHTPPLHWSLGRVECVYPGADGIPRVADVKTSRGVKRRALSKICLLEPEDSNGREDVNAAN